MSLPTGLRRRAVAIVLAAMVAGFGIVATSPESATAASKCTTMRRPIHQFLHPTYGVSVLTSDSSYYPVLKKAGYVDLGVTFKAGGPANGLSAVRELWNPKSFDRIYTRSATEIAGIKKAGYVDRGVAFYAASSGGSCLYPVYRFHKGSGHLYVGSAADRAALVKQGWTQQSVVFWLTKPASVIRSGASTPPPKVPDPTSDAFTIAVMPDTQNETMSANDTRFVGRTNWLVANRSKLNLKFVTHVGDVVSWDTPDHVEYQRAHDALQVLNDNNIPYSLSPGNHDTGAVCVGGSACPGKDAKVTVRDTTTFNEYLNGGVADVQGYFESGKVDNTYSRFAAGGRSWLVLNLELWPRTKVIDWAQTVVAGHPDDNVMVVTHSYLNANGTINQTNGGYGATSPQYLFDNLISKYSNIKTGVLGPCRNGRSPDRQGRARQSNRLVPAVYPLPRWHQPRAAGPDRSEQRAAEDLGVFIGKALAELLGLCVCDRRHRLGEIAGCTRHVQYRRAQPRRRADRTRLG